MGRSPGIEWRPATNQLQGHFVRQIQRLKHGREICEGGYGTRDGDGIDVSRTFWIGLQKAVCRIRGELILNICRGGKATDIDAFLVRSGRTARLLRLTHFNALMGC